MKRLIFYFIILVLSIWVGVKIFHNPGYVLITNQDWVIETTLWFAILASLLILIIIYLLFKLLSKIFHIPERIHKWQLRHRYRKGRKFLYAAIDDLLQGKWKQAEKASLKSTKASRLSLLGYLGAAKAAYNRKLFSRGNHYLKRAKHHCPAMALPIDIALANLQIEQGLYVQALDLLLNLYKQNPKHKHLLELITQCYLQLSDWDNLNQLLPAIKKARILDEEKLKNLEKEIYLHLAKHTINNYETTLQWWKKIPHYLQSDPEILAIYTYYLNEFDHSTEAEKILRSQLNKSWHEQLFQQYVNIDSPQRPKQISFAEKFLLEHPNNPAVLRCMGKLCLKNKLWGQARDYLEKSLKLEKSKEAYRSLGYVMEKIGDTQSALDNYRKGCS